MTPQTPTPTTRAFTLVELLIVCAMIAALLAVAAPATLSLLRASSLNQAVALLSDELNLARQMAMTQNRDIEVRFYKTGSETDSRNLRFRAFRCFYVNGSDPARFEPVGNLNPLPGSVIISDDPAISTLFDYGNPNRAGLAMFQETLPGSTTAVDCLSFVFRPTGGTNLAPIDPPEGNWYLTFYLENDRKNEATGIPGNYVTMQIEPVTGRVRTYRP